jgi:Mrp family chromosome partitioning ATPase/NifU-like protein involved in Fe-S cluster formation
VSDGQATYRIVVFSGKGGVGKTTIAVNLAYSLSRRGLSVGLLDADITGPNVPQMTGIDEPPRHEGKRLVPHEREGVKVVSLASLLPADAPVIWRGPLRSKALEQLLDETEWGELDVLVTDLPPGTGDEVLTMAQKASPQLAIVVTTPQEVALLDARRAVNFARKLEIPTIGLVENMSGLVCPHCGEAIDLFGWGSGVGEALERGVLFLGAVPLDPAARRAGDEGTPIVVRDPTSPVSVSVVGIANRVEQALGMTTPAGAAPQPYSATVIEQARNPQNLGTLSKPDARGIVHGWCGDTMEIQLRLTDGRIDEARFVTDGCGPTIACGSMITSMTTGCSLEEAGRITPEQLIDRLGGLPPESAHCAQLAVNTLRKAIASWSRDEGGP